MRTTAPESNHPEYLLVDEAAEFIRTPKATLYSWRHRGEGPPCRKIGRRLLYNRDDLVEWVESQGTT